MFSTNVVFIKMKLQIYSFCLIASLCGVLAIEDLSKLVEYREGDRYVMISDESGHLQLVDLELTDLTVRFDADKDLNMYLYTKSNPTEPQQIINKDVDSLLNSNYDNSKKTIILVHGWTGTAFEKSCNWPRDAYMEHLDVNILCLDWSIPSHFLYPTSVSCVPEIGRYLANFTDWLISQGSKLEDFHLVGHSLGGHIVGAAGRAITNGKVPYISALDPAMPLWGINSGRIRPDDADYVEIIHTNSNNLGLWDAVGHADFYPNGGNVMPGCISVDISCHHGRSVSYFANSIDNKYFMADQCASLDEIANGYCSNLGKMHMGGASPKNARGVYVLKTTGTPPFYEVPV